MQTEWEATFWPVVKDEVRARLKQAGAVLVYPERLMRRVNLYLPEGAPRDGFVRVRDEGDRITLTVKDMSGTKIEEQLEAEVVVDDFARAQDVLRALGCRDKNYQETKREKWMLGETEVVIDEWPLLEPLIEVEGNSETEVREASERLGFTWSEARFCSTDKIYAERYGVDPTFVTQQIPRLVFGMEDPFPKRV